MQNLKIADAIEVGDKINFAKPLEVVSTGFSRDGIPLWLKINEEKTILIVFPADSFLAVADEPEPDKILDAWDMTQEETMDRVSALISQVGGIPSALEALGFLVELEVFDNTRLVELTNDLGPFVTQTIKS